MLLRILGLNNTLIVKSMVINKWVQRKAGRGQTIYKLILLVLLYWCNVKVRKKYMHHRMFIFKCNAPKLLEMNRRQYCIWFKHTGVGLGVCFNTSLSSYCLWGSYQPLWLCFLLYILGMLVPTLELFWTLNGIKLTNHLGRCLAYSKHLKTSNIDLMVMVDANRWRKLTAEIHHSLS